MTFIQAIAVSMGWAMFLAYFIVKVFRGKRYEK
jgi:hypothetical protein